MALKRTRWSPDTCECVLEYEWDDEEPEDKRGHNFAETISACSVHDDKKNKAAHLTAVIGENRRKNEAVAAAVKALPKLQADTEGAINPDVVPKFKFDADRNVEIWFEGVEVTEVDKGLMRAAVAKVSPKARVR